MKQLINDLQNRFELVSSRLESITLEQATLSQEQEHLQGLLETYKARGDYDTITEERRVMGNLLNPPSKIKVTNQVSKFTEEAKFKMFEALGRSNKPLSGKAVIDSAGLLSNGGVYKILYSMVDDGLLKETRDGRRRYFELNN
jgi:hypothetical protein